MMRKMVYTVHGWSGSPRERIHKWLKQELEKREFEVVAQRMPNPEEPKIKDMKNVEFVE